jgi:hypothetical protein
VCPVIQRINRRLSTNDERLRVTGNDERRRNAGVVTGLGPGCLQGGSPSAARPCGVNVSRFAASRSIRLRTTMAVTSLRWAVRKLPLAAPMVSRKHGARPKTHADRPPARRGAACLTLLGQYSARSWERAAMAAFGESCRRCGHVLAPRFDPFLSSPSVMRECHAVVVHRPQPPGDRGSQSLKSARRRLPTMYSFNSFFMLVVLASTAALTSSAGGIY